MQDEKAVLDSEDIRRTLVRIAHEIVEQNAGERVAIVGIHRRGAVLATRIHALLGELIADPVPLGDIDIAFHRDDLNLRSPAQQPVGFLRGFIFADRTWRLQRRLRDLRQIPIDDTSR